MSSVAQIDDPAAIGPLLDAWTGRRPFRQDCVDKALLRLLPRLHEADAALLTAQRRGALMARLKDSADTPLLARDVADLRGPGLQPREPSLAIAILQVLERLGDENDMPYLRFLARAGAVTPMAVDVRAAAQRSLAAVEARVARARAAGVLLRPASGPPGGEALLRPAGAGEASPPGVLLRPANGPEDAGG